ncbi:hypothetical protein MXD81_52475 [Microbacteriaceae bacterium K1510]|nr:hypothetical protein [Microbacteriaceae bacterium K1510]
MEMLMAIDIPDAFRRFAAGFYQGSGAEHANPQQWIGSALAHLNDQERDSLERFLDVLLVADLSDASLQRLWEQAGADYFLTAHGSVRGFYELVRAEIGRSTLR